MPDWPHAPIHRLGDAGAYMVTASTYNKELLFLGRKRLSYLCDTLLERAAMFGWQLQAWAVLPNHYHFVAISEESESLKFFIKQVHSLCARWVNRIDKTPGRVALYQYRDTHLTFEKSYFARLNYVHYNPVRHGLVKDAEQYPWCSAAWFARHAEASFYKTVRSFKTDKLSVTDIDCGDIKYDADFPE